MADSVFFVGPNASKALPAKRHADDQTLQTFVTVGQLSRFLRGFLQSGDLVLTKGSEKADRLEQLVSEWNVGGGEPQVDTVDFQASASSIGHTSSRSSLSVEQRANTRPTQLIVGLGNPGRRFERTPHNVGRQVLDVLATSLQAKWLREPDWMVARVECGNQPLLLVKPLTAVNNTGPLLQRMASQLGSNPADCVIVHDDVDLALGVVRARMKGSAGGHKGMQSIIVAFESEGFRRVKIGVGRPADGATIARYVLTPFDTKQCEVIDRACREAAIRALELIDSNAVRSEYLTRSGPA